MRRRAAAVVRTSNEGLRPGQTAPSARGWPHRGPRPIGFRTRCRARPGLRAAVRRAAEPFLISPSCRLEFTPAAQTAALPAISQARIASVLQAEAQLPRASSALGVFRASRQAPAGATRPGHRFARSGGLAVPKCRSISSSHPGAARPLPGPQGLLPGRQQGIEARRPFGLMPLRSLGIHQAERNRHLSSCSRPEPVPPAVPGCCLCRWRRPQAGTRSRQVRGHGQVRPSAPPPGRWVADLRGDAGRFVG